MQREAFKVKSGTEYDYLFPKALMRTVLTKKNATVADTIKLIPKIVSETSWQAEKFAAFIKGKTLEETCRNIWEFVYNHIAYKKDDHGKEQVRSFARTWNDRHNFLKDQQGNLLKDEYGEKIPGGVDCDCMTTFISTTLSVLRIKHALRIVKFWENHYQHIYPIVYLPGGGHITLDCVVKNFNYEEPYSEKKDTTMDLEYLNGVYDSGTNRTVDSIDMAGINEYSNDISGLGKLFKKASGGGAAPKKGIIKQVFQKGGVKQIVKNTAQNVKTTVQAAKAGGIKAVAKTFINLTNKVNPGTIPIRAGILAALKTNFFKIAQRLKYAYLSDAEAQKRGVDMGKLSRLRQIRDKLENTFYSMGGNKANFKEAILTGRGNKDKDVVAGLGYVSQDLNSMRMDAPISRLLGSEMYNDENIRGVDGLGEVATAAVITAATGILGAIALLLKQVGSMFPKKSKENQDFENIDAEGAKTTEEANATTETTTILQTNTDTSSSDTFNTNSNANSDLKTESETVQTRNASATNNPTRNVDTNSNSTSNLVNEGSNNTNTPVTTQSDSGTEDANNNTPSINNSSESVAKIEKNFWQKHKGWIVPSSVGAGILIISFVSYKILNKPDASKLKYAVHGLNGVPKSKKKRKKKGGHKPKIKSKKKKAVAFI